MNSETPMQDEDTTEDQRFLNIADDLEDKEDKTPVAKRQVAIATPVLTLSMDMDDVVRDGRLRPAPAQNETPDPKRRIDRSRRAWSSRRTKKRTGEVGRRTGKAEVRIGKKNRGLRGRRWRTT